MSFSSETLQSMTADHERFVKWLYERYAKKLLAYTLRTYLPEEDDAWSVVYKTLYRIADVAAQHEFENEYKFNGFVFRTHINYLRNFLRDTKRFEARNREIELEEHHAVEEEQEPASQSLPMQVLQQELDKLEDWQRILLLMRGQDMPYSKIAEFVDKPEQHLKTYYARLKKQLHDAVNEHLQQIKNTPHANQR